MSAKSIGCIGCVAVLALILLSGCNPDEKAMTAFVESIYPEAQILKKITPSNQCNGRLCYRNYFLCRNGQFTFVEVSQNIDNHNTVLGNVVTFGGKVECGPSDRE